MKIDCKRLSEDLAYWQENEPEGGADYFSQGNGCFYKIISAGSFIDTDKELKEELRLDYLDTATGEWLVSNVQERTAKVLKWFIKKPTGVEDVELDSKKLSEDIEYWEKHEPEGGADYFREDTNTFYKKTLQGFSLDANGNVLKHGLIYFNSNKERWLPSSTDLKDKDMFIKKPKAPTKKAWSGKGAPEVGDIVYLKMEAKHFTCKFPINEWDIKDELEVVSYSNGEPVCMNESKKTFAGISAFFLSPKAITSKENERITTALSCEDLAIYLLGRSEIVSKVFGSRIVQLGSLRESTDYKIDHHKEMVKRKTIGMAADHLLAAITPNPNMARMIAESLYKEGMLKLKDGE